MLLFSTILDIKDSLTKDEFIKLVIEWNQGSPHASNVIPGIVWNGHYSFPPLDIFGMEIRKTDPS